MNRFGKGLALCDSIGGTAKGTLHEEKDSGAGYKYRVTVEEATVKP